jgi:pyruvate dehydrogenase E2 component (dihydrolipoamide acetyltransferase)
MDSGTIASWSVEAGAEFARGDTLLELETDKTLVEYPALESGRLIETLVAEGDVVTVGDPIAVIETDGNWPIDIPKDNAKSAPETAIPAPSIPAPPTPTASMPAASSARSRAPDNLEGLRATPFARRVAQLGNLDLQKFQDSQDSRIPQGSGRRGRIEAGDVIAMLTSGEGAAARDVLLLHGLASNAVAWSGLIAVMANRGQRISALDLPAHGENELGADSVEDLVDYAAAHLQSLDHKVCLVGHSLGAYVAARAALKVPSAVSNLVLIAPAGCGPKINADFIRGLATASDETQLDALLTMLGPKAEALPAAAKATMLGDLRRGRLGNLCDSLLDGDNLTIDLVPLLSALEAEVTISVIMGINDRIVSRDHMFNLPSHVAIHMLDAGHLPQWDAVDQVAALLRGKM